MKNKYKTSNLLNDIELVFEKNIGQQYSDAKYILKQSSGTTYFTINGVVLVLSSVYQSIDNSDDNKEYEINVLRMKLENANNNLKIIGREELKYKVNYFKGNKDEWVTDVPVYESIIYKDVYEDIDLVYYSNEGRLEYDFILKPNAKVENIKIIFEGVDNLSIDEDNNLKVDIKNRSIYLLRPKTYQVTNDNIIEIKSEFIIDENILSFKVGEYDKSKTLVIDPVLLYSTYLGGTDYEDGYSVAVDQNQIAYITGLTLSTDFPTTPNAYDITINGNRDVFLSKIDTKLSGTSSLIYSTYLGGSRDDVGLGVAVDENEIAYIVGYTISTDFPTTPNAYDTTFNGGSDVFLSKIDTKLSGVNSLVYSTYLGGNRSDIGRSVALDQNKNVYITGWAESINFPTTPNAYQTTSKGGSDVFLSKIDTSLSGSSGLIYSTYLGGSDRDEGESVAVDENENAYITGRTLSTDFPTTPNAYQNILSSIPNAFLSRMDTNISGSNGLIYSTYLGGSSNQVGYGVAVDQNQNAYLTGFTSSTNFPTTPNGYQTTLQGSNDAYLTRIDTNLSGNSSLIYSTYLGGSSTDVGQSISVDENQNAYLTGRTSSGNFPTTPDAYQITYQGGQDGFISRIDTSLNGSDSLIYSTYLGGSNTEFVRGIAIDADKNTYITGSTYSSNFPTTPSAYQGTLKGLFNVFLTKMATQLLFAKLETDKLSDPTYVDIGTTITYTITIENTGTVDANNIIFRDTIPLGTKYVDNSFTENGVLIPGVNPSAGVSLNDISAGNTTTVTFDVEVIS